MEGVNHKNLQPPLGYPTADDSERQDEASPAPASPAPAPRGGRARVRGRKTSFIDGCIAALCCCWLCDLCCE
ncbi:hypothetical protein PVAP13_3NG119203 [Panicum virgatum]|uniref:Cysteine-rich transmembrane domain-containing protein n=1 Tax=Panicum virgatum TaxID=38727 RepID=A0A8T0UA17_PANVG|nr:hypothetical protein PVAP13_3NG119203 [Panicum virgatum]